MEYFKQFKKILISLLFIPLLFLFNTPLFSEERPVLRSVLYPTIWQILGYGGGDEAEPVESEQVEFNITSTASLNTFLDARTSGSYARSSAMGTWDFDGKFNVCNQFDVLPMWGARKVTNFCLHSQDISNAYWTKPGFNVSGTDKITATEQDAIFQRTFVLQVDHDYVFHFIAHVEVGQLDNYYLRHANSPTGLSVALPTLTRIPQRYSAKFAGRAGTVVLGFQDGNVSNWAQVTITDFQLEDVTGQTNQNPSDHIPTTSAAVTKYYNTENGNTVASNVVTEAEGDPLTNTIGGAFWPSVTNLFAADEYRDLSNWTWLTATSIKDQIGVDGIHNSANIVTDDDTNTIEYAYELRTIIDDSTWHSFSILIQKDTNTIRYPIIKLLLAYGIQLNEEIILNTQTGAVTEIENDGNYSVFNVGNWWFVTVSVQNNSTGNVSLAMTVSPAGSANGTTKSDTITGSIVVDWAQFVNARRCPIHLVAGGTTLAAQDLHFSNDDLIAASEGSIYLEFSSLPDYSAFINDTVLLANGDCEIRLESLTNGISFNDGTNDTGGPTHVPTGLIKAVVVWEGSSVKITTVNGTTTGTYAGNFGGDTIYVGRNAVGNYVPGYINNVTFYSTALSDVDAALLVVTDDYIPIGYSALTSDGTPLTIDGTVARSHDGTILYSGR